VTTPGSSGLICQDLLIERGGTTIIDGVSLAAEPGEVTVLLGPNGAGKTTLLEGIAGVLRPVAGKIWLAGVDVTDATSGRRARAGLGHVEQGRQVFGELSLEENLLVAAPRRDLPRAYELFPELGRIRNTRAGLLSGGEQQMLVIARAMLRGPRVLLLDEISLGLAPGLVARLLPRVRELADSGVAIVLIEQFTNLALAIGDRAYVLAKGRIEFSGTTSELAQNQQLLNSSYLGAVF
jgi:branched-chain amino acid transport system ATP-binding protein